MPHEVIPPLGSYGTWLPAHRPPGFVAFSEPAVYFSTFTQRSAKNWVQENWLRLTPEEFFKFHQARISPKSLARKPTKQ
jgi:hypothetical protein